MQVKYLKIVLKCSCQVNILYYVFLMLLLLFFFLRPYTLNLGRSMQIHTQNKQNKLELQQQNFR